MNLVEIGKQVQQQRREAGLTQEQLAKMAGISRVTVNHLENGTLNDLGYAKLATLLSLLGLDLQAHQSSGLKNALSIAARTASTSYKAVLTPDTLAAILRTGEAPEQYHPHLMTLLDEAPPEILVTAVREVAPNPTTARQIVKHLTSWAKQWKINRLAWL
jgi:transcriptional regulator with XRE-family HTH domain